MNSVELIECCVEEGPAVWDQALAGLDGHPLQSALWGDTRRKVDGIREDRWMVRHAGAPVWMLRVERRVLPLFGWVAWAPRGPTGDLPGSDGPLPKALREKLKSAGAKLLVTDKWVERDGSIQKINLPRLPRTIWIDLEAGRDAVWAGLHSGWRNHVRRAERKGVVVQATRSPEDVRFFYDLCVAISGAKEFVLPGSHAQMAELLKNGNENVEAVLFATYHHNELSSGALIMRCGRSIHYMWGAVDRRFSNDCIGEAVHWAAIEWALQKGCATYDLGGIDRIANSGTYMFKKKMGGKEVDLSGKEYVPLGILGYPLAWLDARRA